MPFAMLAAVGIDALDLGGIGNIPRLYDRNAVVAGIAERTVELAVIMAGRAAGFVMADQVTPFALA